MSAPLALAYNIMQRLRRHEHYEMTHWSLHALRMTARTNISILTPFPQVGESMLGHKLPKNWRIYAGHNYLTKQVIINKDWWERLRAITASVPERELCSEVVPVRERTRH